MRRRLGVDAPPHREHLHTSAFGQDGTSGDERWAGGNGTCHNFDHIWSEDKAVSFRACEEIDLWPDDCSSWKGATS